MRNEVSYYPEIQGFIETQLKSNFASKNHRELYVYWGIGELKANLQRIIRDNPDICYCAASFTERTPPLNLDIFALITDGAKFELLIIEVKRVKGAGLSEWSQLMGYCLVSGAKYGLLVNIDNGGSPRLTQMLQTEQNISYIQTIVNGNPREHLLGFMEWDSLTKNFGYTNLGEIRSLSSLSAKLANDFV